MEKLRSIELDEQRDRSGAPSQEQQQHLEQQIADGNNAKIGHLSGIKLGLVITSLSLSVFLVLLDSSVISTAIPKITDDFHSLKDVGWYASSYQLGSAVLQMLTGKVFNHFNLKWSYIVFFLIFEVGSALSGAAQTSAMLIISRTISGVGASALINGAITIVSASAPIERRPALTGIILGFSQLGVVIGPLIGGAFTTGYTWRWCFYINLPLGLIVAVPLLLIHIPEQIPKRPPREVIPQLHKHLDLVGFTLFAPFIVMLLLAIQFGGNQFAWDSSQVIGLFVGSGVTFLVWVVWNYRKGEDGLLPFPILKRRIVWMSGLYYTCMCSSLIGCSYFLPIYFQAVKGVTAIMSGVYTLATIVPQVIGAVGSGMVIGKTGFVPPFAVGGSVFFIIGAGLYTTLQPGTPTANWVGYQILSGFGRGLGFQMSIIATQHAVSAQELSAAMAFIVWCQYMGPSIFLTLFNTIFDTKLVHFLRQDVPTVNPQVILSAGATNFRKVVPANVIPGVLKAYSDSLDIVFYMVLALSFVCFFAGFGMGFKDIRVKPGQASTKLVGSSGRDGRSGSNDGNDGNDEERAIASESREDQARISGERTDNDSDATATISVSGGGSPSSLEKRAQRSV
ncbi:mfs transporter [Ophiostoma piceae UAMH 11346]|uniref:Mfs transporter n=1 Tax=Ophiostoma piceae (strain UAMH 11346) TaxID=1262450 RepID=S3BSH6_OPHP1|nr:mfs transporter [Ophiostoma piceae UAMH 11346]